MTRVRGSFGLISPNFGTLCPSASVYRISEAKIGDQLMGAAWDQERHANITAGREADPAFRDRRTTCRLGSRLMVERRALD
jgi:hypothetical protein